MSAPESHRTAAIQTLTRVIEEIPVLYPFADMLAEKIVDHMAAHAVEVTRDLLTAEAKLKR